MLRCKWFQDGAFASREDCVEISLRVVINLWSSFVGFIQQRNLNNRRVLNLDLRIMMNGTVRLDKPERYRATIFLGNLNNWKLP